MRSKLHPVRRRRRRRVRPTSDSPDEKVGSDRDLLFAPVSVLVTSVDEVLDTRNLVVLRDDKEVVDMRFVVYTGIDATNELVLVGLPLVTRW